MTFFDYLKNIFIFLIFLQVTPTLIQSIKKQYSTIIIPKTSVGVIKMNGMLHHSSWYAKQLHTFFKDPNIKAILLKIESSGSAAGTGQALCNEILALKKEYPKPIITLTENICASGAYYIASATDHIISSGQAIIGSIGSYMPYLFQVQGLLDAYHIKYEPIKAGTYKTMTDPFTTMTDQERAQLQSVVDDSYAQFVADVAQNRKLSIQSASEWAEGKLFTGKQALNLGLVDELGSAYQAIAHIKNIQLIEGEIEWIQAEPRGGFLQRLIEQDEGSEGTIFSQLGLSIYQCVTQYKQMFDTPNMLSL